MSRWGKGDPDAAIEWLGSFEDGAPRDQWLEALVNQVSIRRPGKAFDYAVEQFAGYHQQRVLTDVLGSWMPWEPERAFEHLLELPVETQSREMVEKVGAEIRDVELAQTLLARLPSQDQADGFISGMARGARAGHYAQQPGAFTALVDLIGGLTDAKAQSQAASHIAEGWLAADAVNARAWIAETDLLSDRVRGRLLNPNKNL